MIYFLGHLHETAAKRGNCSYRAAPARNQYTQPKTANAVQPMKRHTCGAGSCRSSGGASKQPLTLSGWAVVEPFATCCMKDLPHHLSHHNRAGAPKAHSPRDRLDNGCTRHIRHLVGSVRSCSCSFCRCSCSFSIEALLRARCAFCSCDHNFLFSSVTSPLVLPRNRTSSMKWLPGSAKLESRCIYE